MTKNKMFLTLKVRKVSKQSAENLFATCLQCARFGANYIFVRHLSANDILDMDAGENESIFSGMGVHGRCLKKLKQAIYISKVR